ncbi:hypothetical protein ABZ793_00850 [Micromonospora sp. NPDC047465]|uniref:hypothetical protein n=1 Tax=Micromonospora sp. NPDC047465 TaxID=3154813 RepID=UPI0033D275E6
MAGAKTPTAPAAKKSSPKAAAVIWLVSGMIVLGCVVAGMVNSGSGDDDVPSPTAQERADTVPILQRSADSQGICYGWVLQDYFSYSDPLSVGSNLGDGVAVEENPACPRWVQVDARVAYTSESSESNDFARIDVTGSADISTSQLFRIEDGLTRFGLTEDVFIDDPGWAITRAAVTLPLLAVEAGLVEPAATPAADAATPAPLSDAGNDLWRDRWGYLLAALGLLLLTGLLVAVGLWQRRRQLRGEAEKGGANGRTPTAPRQQSAKRDARRTPEGR